MTDVLRDLVAWELSEPVDPSVAGMATALAARYPGAARAVLFYGSCLRTAELDGQMLDFYLIVSDYRSAYGRSWMAPANRLLPPNVFPFHHGRLAAKYAVLSEADFRREMGTHARSVSVWARFAQPSRLAWVEGPQAAGRMAAIVAEAAPTLFRYTLPMMEPGEDRGPLDVWRRGFSLTYEAELRSERATRPSSIVDTDPERYRRFGEAALARIASLGGAGPNGEVAPPASQADMQRWWRRTQRRGKLLSVLRLAKASGTYAGGIDYLAWKINRHAGTKITISPWQRRWPLLAAVTLLPQLLKQRAIR